MLAALVWMSLLGQTKVVTLPIWQDYVAAPTTLREFVRGADAIARVRVEAFHFEAVPDAARGGTRDVTRYSVKILDTLKPHAQLPPTDGNLTVTRLGGEHLENGTLIRSVVQGFEPLRETGDYLLCLSWNARTNDFDIFFGPDGVFELTSEFTVRPLGHQPVAEQQQGKPVADFLDEVRDASAR